MLEYVKMVLQKVSFNRDLFKKELEKSKKLLNEEEINVLQSWCNMSFRDKYPEIIIEVFNKYSA